MAAAIESPTFGRSYPLSKGQEQEKIEAFPPSVSLVTGLGRVNWEAYNDVANVIKNQGIAVVDYGATFATVFDPHIREKVGEARKEKGPPYVPVSLMSTASEANKFVDFAQIPKKLAADLPDLEDMLEGEAFLRLPAIANAEDILGKYTVSWKSFWIDERKIQFFFLPNNDPLLNILLHANPRIPALGVRSANLEGEPERTMPSEAYRFAKRLGADIFATRFSEKAHAKKERVGSMPIIEIPTNEQVRLDDGKMILRIIRNGNIHPETLRRQIMHILPYVEFQEALEKPQPEYRQMYYSFYKTPEAIKRDIQRKSGENPHLRQKIADLLRR